MQNVKSNPSTVSIQTVGLLIDENHFLEKEILIKELVANGIIEENIKTVVYRKNANKKESYLQPNFSTSDINWKAEITNSEINNFINQEFDLLINYYEVERSVLLNITYNSKALFKVGFSSVDKRLNHLIINTSTENHTVFVNELFRYLKILNKI